MTRRFPLTSTLITGVFPIACALAFTGCGGNGYGGGPSGGGGGGGGTTPDATISIVPGAFNKGIMAFSPDRDTVQVGNVVRMQNGDTVLHNIQGTTAGGPSWGGIAAGGSSDVTVTQAGTFGYQCVVGGHTMSGTLVVLP